LDKSNIFFGNSCQEEVKNEVKTKLGVQSELLQDYYLGMPTKVGRSPIMTFRYLYDRMWQCVNGLSDRPLSRKGNEIFLKAVIQAIPKFVMSCFQLPVATCEMMRRIIADQWWGMENGQRKLHWRSWDWLSSPKAMGGLGFRDIEIFNQAMLGRQCWRLLTDPTSLCARVLKGRYFPHCNFWEASCPRSSLYTWRSIIHGRKLVQQGTRWCVGDGSTIRILQDNWIHGIRPEMLRTLSPLTDGQTVDSLLNEETQSWNVSLVRYVF
jgi:hypothetical protein